MSGRAYARHLGVTEGAVRKALAKGQITAQEDGTIDPITADAEWKSNVRTRVRTERVGTRGGGGGEEGTQSGFVGALQREMERAARSSESKLEAERRKEIALANIREREDAVGAGRVVDRQATARAWFAVCRTTRDQLLAVRDRLQIRLGLNTETADVVTEELRAVLRELTREVPGLGDPLPEKVEV